MDQYNNKNFYVVNKNNREEKQEGLTRKNKNKIVNVIKQRMREKSTTWMEHDNIIYKSNLLML
jgi:hypothetical protein